MNKQELANKIWESANQMRSKIEANEYKDYILGFIFYKYLSDKELNFLKSADFTEDYMKEVLNEEDESVFNYVRNNMGYFIAYDNLFSTWIAKGKDFDVSNVRDALSAFSRLIPETHIRVFGGIFETLETGLSKLGDTAANQTKAIRELLYLIKDIPMDGKQDYDVLGFIYEYLISMFAANAGKKAGEFYTPHEVSELMSEIVAEHLKDKNTIEIYDPTSGSGSLLITIGKAVSKHIGDDNKIKYYAQELKKNTYDLTRMNLVMRGISPDNIMVRNGDTLENDWPFFEDGKGIETYKFMAVDAVVSNPPYSQKWDPKDKENDLRYKNYGLAPKSKADYAFLLHDLYHIRPDGIMTIVLPHGVLFRGGEEGQIRKNLIENNNIDAIIGLPANIFFGTGIPTIIMVLRQKRENSDVLIVDASKGFAKVGKNNKLRASDIKRILDVVIKRESIDKFSKVVSKEEIRNNDYNLNIPRYVDSSEKTESWDIYATMFGGIPSKEIDELSEYWNAFPGLKEEIFDYSLPEYAQLKVDNVNKIINEAYSVKKYVEDFKARFSDYKEYLHTELIDNMEQLNSVKEKEVLTNDLFNRLSGIELVDKYAIYELLDENWKTISVDLEIIKTEGKEVITQVDPNMVTKKKDGNEKVVQEGWIGHIIPFELVQKILLESELKGINDINNRLSNIASEYEEIFSNLTEEEKENDVFNEAGDSFDNKLVKKYLKDNKKDLDLSENSFDSKVKMIDSLADEEKKLKKDLKTLSDELHEKTKVTIENLSEDEQIMMLVNKWILPLNAEIINSTDKLIKNLIERVNHLSNKYEQTLMDIDSDLHDSERELSNMINELTGDAFDMQGLKELQKLLGDNNE